VDWRRIWKNLRRFGLVRLVLLMSSVLLECDSGFPKDSSLNLIESLSIDFCSARESGRTLARFCDKIPAIAHGIVD
jgi:hypothetical protein